MYKVVSYVNNELVYYHIYNNLAPAMRTYQLEIRCTKKGENKRVSIEKLSA